MSAVVIDIDAVPHILSITRDISQRKEAQEQQLLAASVFSNAREGILITSASFAIVSVNDAFTNITGYGREEVLGKNPSILGSGLQQASFYRDLWLNLKENGFWKGEISNRRKNGEVYAETLTISAVMDELGNIKNYVGIFSDISAIKEHERELEHMAHFDALTNLPNRVLLADRLRQSMSQAQRRSQPLAVVYLDLDGFKAINDKHGHEIGDQLLVAIASRMKQTLREGDTLARLGGDEFVAVLQDMDDIGASIPLLNRLLTAAYQSLQIGILDVQVSASLGVTFYPQSEDVEADQLLRQADQAMYQAKVAGKNRYKIFDATSDFSLRTHYESLGRIELALKQKEFVLYFQPKVNMRTGEIIGAEALIRWQHPQRGLLAPSEFLPVIENHSLAIDVGEWVIDTALAQIEIWREAGLNLAVSVNVGARQLQQSNFFDRLRKLLTARPSVKPSFLELEVLETSALEDIAQVSRLIESCAEIGVTFALDDFGTGYSSLTYLKRLRVNVLKIDQSFVRDMLDDPDDLAILEGVIGLAAAFRRQVIAEGVETIAHGTLLLQLGCDLAQGYGIARPMPANELLSWAATWQPDSAWSELPWMGGQVSD
jgi:diguanylate cyclase (GGDEF)-like protein/PAS domain S-box-containing protein